jgi:hypothetical protein
LREILPEFVVRPVQALDTPLIRPRAQLTLHADLLAGVTPGGVAETEDPLNPITIDLFDPPLHVHHLAACLQLKRDDPRRTLHEIGDELSISGMTVKRSLHYARLMERQGLMEPYRELQNRPARASRWR